MRFSIQISDGAYHHLSRMAASRNLSLSAMAREIIEEKISGQKSFEQEALEILVGIEKSLIGKSKEKGEK